MDFASWRNDYDGYEQSSSRADSSSSSDTSSSFLLITGVRVDNIPEAKKGKVFVVVRAGAKAERTSRTDNRKGSAAWVNLKMKMTDINSTTPTSISFELHRDRPFFSKALLANVERPIQDFLHPGSRSLVLQLFPSATYASASNVVPICCTIEFDNSVESVAQDIFIPPLNPEPVVSPGSENAVNALSVSQTFNPAGSLSLLSSGLGKLLDSFQPYAEVLERVSKIHPAAQVAYFFISSAYTVVKHQYDRDASLVELFQIMMRMYEVASMKDILNADNTFATRFKFRDMIHQSIECSLFISGYSSKGYLRRLTTMNVSSKVAEFKTAFESMEREFTMRLARTTASATLSMRPSIEFVAIEATLKQMKPVEPLAPRLSCMSGTRRETLRMITNWISQSEQSVIWLHGMAGTGKSSLMGSLSDIALEMGICNRLGAFIRFDRFEYSDPTFFVKTLANELARFDDRLGRAIANAVSKRMANHTQLSRQFSALVLEPLEMIADEMKDEGPVVVLVDGVDECQKGAKREELLRLLAGGFGAQLPFMRLVISSRLEEDIKKILQRNPQIHALVLDTASSETTGDIRYFINTSLNEIGEDYPEFQEHCQSMDAASKLAERASGLFIWASTIVAFIAHLPMERLSRILSTEVPTSALKALTILYQIALTSIADETGDDDIKSSIRTILGSIITVTTRSQGISQSILEGILPYVGVERVNTLIDKMGSIVSADYTGNLRLLHKSFDDFLMDKERCGADWAIDLKAYHQNFTTACLRRLHAWYDETQKENRREFEVKRAQAMAEQMDSDSDAQFPGVDILYCSNNWYQYACTCSEIPHYSSLQVLLERMLKVYFLRWLEDRTGELYESPLATPTDALVPSQINFTDHQIIGEHLETFLRTVHAMVHEYEGLPPRISMYLALLIKVPAENLFRKYYLAGFHKFANSITTFQVDRLVFSSFGVMQSIATMRHSGLQFHLASFLSGRPCVVLKDLEGRRWSLVDVLTADVQRKLIIPQNEPAVEQCIESDGTLYMVQRLHDSKVQVLTWNAYGDLDDPLHRGNLKTSAEFSISESERIFIYDGMVFASVYGSPSTIQSWVLRTGQYFNVSIDTAPDVRGVSLYTDRYCAIFGSHARQNGGFYQVYNPIPEEEEEPPTTGMGSPEPITTHYPITCTAVSADRTRFAIAQSDTTVTVFNFMTLDRVTQPVPCFSRVRSICFSPDGSTLLVCTDIGACVLDAREQQAPEGSEFSTSTSDNLDSWDWPPLGSSVSNIVLRRDNYSSQAASDISTDSIMLPPCHSTEINVHYTSASKLYASIQSRDGTKSLLLLEDGSVLVAHCATETGTKSGTIVSSIEETTKYRAQSDKEPLRPSYLCCQGHSMIISRFPIEFIRRRSAVMSETEGGVLVRITASEDGVLQASLDFKWSEL